MKVFAKKTFSVSYGNAFGKEVGLIDIAVICTMGATIKNK
jgi:hypothetical protein